MSSSSYTRIENTTVSGSALLGSLSAGDISALNYAAVLGGPTLRPPSSTAGTAISNAVSVTAEQLVNAAVLPQGVVVDASAFNNVSNTLNANGLLSLGSDTAANAKSYQALFNLTTTTDAVAIQFVLNATVGSPNANDILLGNTSATANRVTVDGATTGVLFANAATAGSVKRMIVTSSNFTSGSEVVNFDLLAVRAGS